MNFVKPTKAIIPVAGYGTRRLPVAKSVEKCMMPLLNRPIVDYIVEDCIKAGITDIYFVITNGAPQLKSYYATSPVLEEYLSKKGAFEQLEAIKPPQNVNFHYVQQEQPNGEYGTTVPIWSCRDIVEPDENVVIIMGDQTLYREDGGSDVADMIASVMSEQTNAGMVAVPVPDDQVQYYGIIAKDDSGHFSHIVEKPSLDVAPSNLNNASIYLVPGSFWQYVQKDMDTPHSHEYYITDVLNEFVADNHTIKVFEAKGKYLDCGNLEGWVEANNYMLEHKLDNK